jgi:hypothetical protein
MTTSGVTAWSLTARDHIQAALEDAKIIALGRTPRAAELDACLRRLNGMLKSWSTRANLFREAETTVPVTAGDATVTLPVGVRDVSGVRHVISATNERPLQPWTRGQYLQMPNKAAVGNPTIYYLTKTIGAAELTVWPVPSSNITLKIDYSRVAETVTDGSETIDIPEEWQEAVWKNLAIECAEIFGAELSPRYMAAAERLYQQLLDSDRPDYYAFEYEGGPY